MDLDAPSTSSGIIRTCCIHVEDVSEKSKVFTADTLKKCQLSLACRKHFNMKYAEIEIPYQSDFSNLGYHSICYRKLTAIKKAKMEAFLRENEEEDETEIQEINKKRTLERSTRSKNTFLKNRSIGILKKSCIFCNKLFIYKNKKRIRLTNCQTKNFETNIKQYALSLNDQKLLSKITDIDFIAKEIHYHRPCRVKYTMQVKKRSEIKNKEGLWHTIRNYHRIAFGKLKEFIKTYIIEKRDAYFLTSTYRIYMQYFFEIAEDHTERSKKFTFDHLFRKLRMVYINLLKFTKHRGRVIIHSKDIDSATAVHICLSKTKTLETDLQNVAFALRRDILRIKKNTLPSQITLKEIYNGECSIPPLLHTFFTNLLCGPYDRRLETNRKIRIESLAQDAINSVTNGRIKTSKHMELGMVIKSLTGSRKAINILNRLGHSVSYSVVEELETELTYSSFEGPFITPYGIQQKPDLSTALAFDNYDRFVDTLSGKDTLHDTVGIIYQNKSSMIDNTEENNDGNNQPMPTNQRKRRRMFDTLDVEIEPYYKKPKLNEIVHLPLLAKLDKTKYKNIRQLDNLWVMSLAILKEDVPMWAGWNNLKINESFPVQNVCYLPPINESPTSLSVVAHTLNTAQNIAVACQQNYISVTYDLAIAKLAMQIQSEERPKYDNVFIQLGSFHIQMSYFKAVGKYIEESGGPYILTESLILAPGSLKGFITGTHYNRCKRIHPIFAASLQVLHFRAYLQANNICIDQLTNELKMIQKQKLIEVNYSKNLMEILDGYDHYYHETEEGLHGATAKYWITYVNLIKLFQEFSRSIRTGDFELYVSCLPQIATLMFYFNHQNYARWIVRFYNNLVNVENTHPGLKETLVKGGISIRRNEKSFSGCPIDLTLEQTINKDAASKLTGNNLYLLY